MHIRQLIKERFKRHIRMEKKGHETSSCVLLLVKWSQARPTDPRSVWLQGAKVGHGGNTGKADWRSEERRNFYMPAVSGRGSGMLGS